MEKETKLTKIKVFSYVFLALVLIVAAFFYFKSWQKNTVTNPYANDKVAEVMAALLEKNDYFQNEELKVEIENRENNVMCFSSCYPYEMQTKKNGWSNYAYSECGKENIAQDCVYPNQSKAFGISLSEMFLEPATHRLVIPVCVGCAIGEQFRVDKIIYSNEFVIK